MNGLLSSEPPRDLFDDEPLKVREELQPGAFFLQGFALAWVEQLLPVVADLDRAGSFRQMVTPGGSTMSAAMTNVGRLGWISDRRGYRYAATDPLTGAPWPAMPPGFAGLARAAADCAGFPHFLPDACLVNRYRPGDRLTLHQDRNELDMSAPIVSVSLGIPATFLLGGNARSDKARRIALHHGDVLVWGGPSRLRYHGVLPIRQAVHPLLGARRINLTLRRADRT